MSDAAGGPPDIREGPAERLSRLWLQGQRPDVRGAGIIQKNGYLPPVRPVLHVCFEQFEQIGARHGGSAVGFVGNHGHIARAT